MTCGGRVDLDRLESDLMELVDCPPYHRLVAGRKELDGMATGIVQGLA